MDIIMNGEGCYTSIYGGLDNPDLPYFFTAKALIKYLEKWSYIGKTVSYNFWKLPDEEIKIFADWKKSTRCESRYDARCDSYEGMMSRKYTILLNQLTEKRNE